MAKKKAEKPENEDVSVVVAPEKAGKQLQNFNNLKSLRDGLNKHYGANVIQLASDVPPVRLVRMNEPAWDYILDGGIPVSRVTEFLGDEHSGKSRTGYVGMANWQRYCFSCNTDLALTAVWKKQEEKTKEEAALGIPVLKSCTCSHCKNPKTAICGLVDHEGTFDPRWVRMLGVDLDGILYVRTDTPSTVVDVVDSWLRMPEIGLILVDSVGSLGSDSEVQTAQADIKMNPNARFLNMAMRKWQAAMNANCQIDPYSPTSIILINQMYQTIGHISMEVPQGGRGLRHGKGMSVKTRIRERVYADSAKTKVIGVHVAIKNEKNKTGIPYRKAEFFMNLDPRNPMGYCMTDIPMQLMELGIALGAIETRGAYIYYGSTSWFGKVKFLESLRTDPDALEAIKSGVYRAIAESLDAGKAGEDE